MKNCKIYDEENTFLDDEEENWSELGFSEITLDDEHRNRDYNNRDYVEHLYKAKSNKEASDFLKSHKREFLDPNV